MPFLSKWGTSHPIKACFFSAALDMAGRVSIKYYEKILLHKLGLTISSTFWITGKWFFPWSSRFSPVCQFIKSSILTASRFFQKKNGRGWTLAFYGFTRIASIFKKIAKIVIPKNVIQKFKIDARGNNGKFENNSGTGWEEYWNPRRCQP